MSVDLSGPRDTRAGSPRNSRDVDGTRERFGISCPTGDRARIADAPTID
jgi:hypothetical protein